MFFTADQHFGHANIIKYTNRPFDSVEEMDEILIQNWNEVVKPNDTVWFLGDFAFKADAGVYLDRLNGNINIVWGNHDKSAKANHSRFAAHTNLIDTRIEDIYITMCHYAMRVWYKSHFNAWQLYGHSHGGLPPRGKQHDVGVDNNNFYPISFDDLKVIMSKRPNNVNYLGDKNDKNTSS